MYDVRNTNAYISPNYEFQIRTAKIVLLTLLYECFNC